MGIRVLGQSAAPALYLYHSHTSLGWRVIRRIAFAQGERKVESGAMRRVVDDVGSHIGYQLVEVNTSRGDRDMPSTPSSSSISLREMHVNAEGDSRTLNMTEKRRAEWEAKGRPPEDLAERVTRKVQVFKALGSARGDVLRVWPSNVAEPLGV